MTEMSLEPMKGTRLSVPSLIFITVVLAIFVNSYLLYFSQTVIFDPLFYIPIILAGYYYPKRGVTFAGTCAVLYLLIALAIPAGSHESALASLGHAGIFILIGYVVSTLKLHYSRDFLKAFPFKRLSDVAEVSFKKPGLILNLIVLTSALALVLNLYLLFMYQSLIFDPLFYFPVILIAYFYPHRGVIAATCLALLFCGIVLTTAYHSAGTVITGLLHAGLLVIIGFVVSYIVSLYSRDQEIHKRLAGIVESSRDAIIGETLDGTITNWNPGAEHLYGYNSDEMEGKSITLLVPPDRSDEVTTLLTKIAGGEVIERYETERITKDKQRIWVSLSISPITDDAGTVIGASVISYDITDRKLAEDALERANKKIHLFSSITRHDVLNQLTVLNIYHNLTESMTDDPVALSFLDKAKRAADAISRQIQFTHEYQEIGAKKPQWFDIRGVFSNAAVMSRNRQITVIPCNKGFDIFADPLLEQALYKLIDHSVTYGAVVTRIRCSSFEDNAGLTVVYEDNGVGIAAEDKQKIFEWTSGDDTRLGLFLVREILSITGITIMENGEPGKGARFEIRVPPGVYRFTEEKGA